MIQRESEVLEGSARTAREGMSDVASLLRQRREELTTGTEEMRRATAETEEMLSNRGREVRTTVEGILERWRALGDVLAERGESLRETGEGAVERAEKVIQTLEQHTGEFAHSTDRLENKVESLRDQLREQARDMQSAIDQVSERAETLASTFRMQEHALIEAAEEAVRNTEEVRAASIDANRGVLLHTVNRVLDTLGSVGVELDRIMDGDGAQEAARRFSRGDRTVALRKIAARVREPVAIARVRELYEEDQEFRALAIRYLREFERLLTQAGDADLDELLSASLLTADVGKAYLLLSRAVDRHK